MDLRRRVMGWRAAERREQVLRAQEGPMAPEEAFEAALEIHDLLPREWERLEALRARETAAARAAWQTLRARLGRFPAGTRRR
jgi:hypothetical protein